MSTFARAGAVRSHRAGERRVPGAGRTRHPVNDTADRAMIARRLAMGVGCSPLGGPPNGEPATPFEQGQLVSPPEGAVASCTVTWPVSTIPRHAAQSPRGHHEGGYVGGA